MTTPSHYHHCHDDTNGRSSSSTQHYHNDNTNVLLSSLPVVSSSSSQQQQSNSLLLSDWTKFYVSIFTSFTFGMLVSSMITRYYYYYSNNQKKLLTLDNNNNNNISLSTQQQQKQVSHKNETNMNNHSNVQQQEERPPRWPWDRLKRKHQQQQSLSSSLPPPRLDNATSSKVVQNSSSSSSSSSSDDDNNNKTIITTNSSKLCCIGNIFGLDVGGTLAKLCYFESAISSSSSTSTMMIHHPIPTGNTTTTTTITTDSTTNNSSSSSSLPVVVSSNHNHHRLLSLLLLPTSSSSSSSSQHYHHHHHRRRRRRTRSTDGRIQQHQQQQNCYNEQPPLCHQFIKRRSWVVSHDKQHIHQQQQQQQNTIHVTKEPSPSLWDMNHHDHDSRIRRVKSMVCISTTSTTSDTTITDDASILFTHNHNNHEKTMNHHHPLYDTKNHHHAKALHQFYNFANQHNILGQSGVRDYQLTLYCKELDGYFHFIRFETRRMMDAMELIRTHKLHDSIYEMGSTGGGAHKFASIFQQELGITMKKQDELDSQVAGMQFVLSTVVGECYTYRPNTRTDCDTTASVENNPNESNLEHKKKTSKIVDEWSRKVQRDSISNDATAYPYLVVTIGTGVSILRVDGPRKYERVSGSTIGGGTYLGLIRLLTDVEDFDDVMRLAERGDPTKVDMMVGDIYGENSDALEKLGLPSDLVASSFGKLVAKDDPATGLQQEDLARALLLMITNNIGQVAYLNAKIFQTPRIYFVGNFLRQNSLSQRRLSYAINYWSKGEMEALFLEHEGYFGALGAFLLTQDISLPEIYHRRRHTSKDDMTTGIFFG